MELTLLFQRGANASNERGWLKRKDFPQKKEDGNEEAKWWQQLHPAAARSSYCRIPVVPIESYKKSTWTELTHTDSLDDSSPSLRLLVEEGCLSAPPGEDGPGSLKNGRGW